MSELLKRLANAEAVGIGRKRPIITTGQQTNRAARDGVHHRHGEASTDAAHPAVIVD